ncbi:transporter substrate-binding domain-containing protein [uncultured Desulfuromusa sp.]|uniref:transporter substrate-binding domain-containing protein n=1 Tax=uncultured Desulfuromusa sp. TaxID=219183 RepID=UPI002AA625F6|nr:transporter substrate-binding domain-containing protein [uncultured Desulfuromusa sp.]
MHSSNLKKIFPSILIITLLLGFSSAIVFAEDPAQLDLPVRIGGDYNYPPYEYLDQDGLPTGYNVELSQAVARVMGMEINIQLGSWGEMRQALERGDVDLLMGMAHTKERLDEVEFSIPHAKVHQSIWIRDDNKTIRSIKDLAGKEIIVMKGSVMHDYMLDNEITADLFMVQTLADALRLLASGHHDCALVAKLPGEYLLTDSTLSHIHPIARPLVAQDYGFAVKKGNLELLARFNEGLSLLKKSGEYRQIREKWLGVLQPEPISWKNFIRYGALIIGPLMLVLIAFALWSWTLRRQVFLRTAELEREIAERMRSAEELQIRQKQLLHADKMTSLGVLVAGVAHEINNPNGLIQLSLPQLRKAHQSIEPILESYYRQHGDFKLGWFDYSRMRQEIPKMLEEMLESSNRIKRIVEDLKDFARRNDSGLDDMVDLNDIIRSALRLVDNALRKATRHFQADYASDLPCFRGNGHRIEQVVVNLILNACQALTSVDQAIELRTYEQQDDNMVVLEVRDQGCGLDEDTLRRITDPFFTTKRETGGTGLGLSVSEGIVKDHLGRLEFSSQPGQGMVVRLLLPIYEERR